jgi:transposase-like protein
MRAAKGNAARRCPQCGKTENQVNACRNRSGTQRCCCNDCKKYYTFEPERNAYDEETRKLAVKIYCSGVSGRKAGLILRMSKANVYNWIEAKATKKRATEKQR